MRSSKYKLLVFVVSHTSLDVSGPFDFPGYNWRRKMLCYISAYTWHFSQNAVSQPAKLFVRSPLLDLKVVDGTLLYWYRLGQERTFGVKTLNDVTHALGTTEAKVVITDRIFGRTHSALKKDTTLHSTMPVKLLQKKKPFFELNFWHQRKCWVGFNIGHGFKQDACFMMIVTLCRRCNRVKLLITS